MKPSIAQRTTASLIFSLALATAAPAVAADPPALPERVAAMLRDQQGPGTRFGLVVATLEGREIVALAPDDRFVPASNTKIYTTALAFARMPAIDQPDATGGAAVRLEGGDVILEGNGDARLSSAPDCKVDCLATLADAVAAATRRVGDVIGDDTLFPDERWGPGMSWNNIGSRSGTAISALTIDDNELAIEVRPGKAGQPALVSGFPYYTIDNRVTTVPSGGKTAIRFARAVNARAMVIDGTIAVGDTHTLRLGIDDPADFAASRLKALLIERGVTVKGRVDVRHRPLAPADDPAIRGAAPAAAAPLPVPLARLTPPPLAEDLTLTNKVSQNLHADLLLRRVSRIAGSGSIADGQVAMRAMLTGIGVPRWSYDLSDGSGMSNYNRVTPRATVALLRWTTQQPWGAAFRATLPVGGVDGTLSRRFKGTPLEGRVFAKTGTLNQANAVAGFLTAASGQTLVFAAYANDMPDDASATRAVDAALNLIAAEN
ncbi:D-alanyl-D-alanine carboxypeptidase/D-alanyl-D-alanine endopeptidase [Sphingomonas sp.]|uniref:D-alanyl-D-alanine carboxypeptidase/D-alanyl-D-alanine endopeptidase n=1 Tax=Sphingomonas sp. TaxID=28214 RepID=UPI002BE3BC16|nr:D-alanyl-D-alanine carboxypeptidase/D-alanyl-D-alanine-endopeptidase [Sphingomonas sp.]HWK35171.1 D-alanyl-D-alanine carboxypeptidase/D-alanyl-D-alanine-endopeptidase [Sphingomonas sp.]